MNKKTAIGAAVALVVVAYGGATWYMGQRAQASYDEALVELRKAVGPQAIVSEEYRKGFFTSQAKLVLQWTPPAAATKTDAGAPASPPLRLVVDSTVHHGPWAGRRFAAAVVDSRFALEGLDPKVTKELEKVTAPTLTTVHHLSGSHDLRFLVPAGEIGNEEMTMRWQEMVSEMTLNGDRTRVNGTFQWPDVSLVGLPGTPGEKDDEEDEEEKAKPASRIAFGFKGMEGKFEYQVIDGMWLFAPGTGTMRFAQIDASSTPAAGGAATSIMALKDVAGSSTIENNGTTGNIATSLNGKGSVGPIEFESIGFEEKFQRIDVQTIKTLQQALIEEYRTDGVAKATAKVEDRWLTLLQESAPRLVGALPAYSMKILATYKGQQGQLEYGAEVQRAPTAEEVAQTGWQASLIKGSTLNASMRLPKAWLPPIAQAVGQKEMKAEDMDAMIGMAQAAGYLRQESDNLVSVLKMEAGQVKLNGKAIDLPKGAF
ncbi:YdgA family protein [Paracidovorax valerianellae]|uniref:Uncharacterized conserved protein YdgA, DUF945 family n=1 Tax=Paracidovorax valerianellae TaxID=187868 RepID=A0A1G6VF08_9BURK|nr:YdgA family protein [Paracidovorax valerianellae]MDA8447154.1 YdgA family protein [Paracidovorax valerianellae]SDD51436.1 Uncharacterized conserved protein YdgA, DUF945 family [Paracidovorax valerianellae]